MKHILSLILIIALVTMCGKENIPTPPEPEPIGNSPKISGLSNSRGHVVYPADCQKEERFSFQVSENGVPSVTCGAGLSAEITPVKGDEFEMSVKALEGLEDRSYITVTARNEYGSSSETLSIEKAYLSIDRESFNAPLAGAVLSVSVSSNVGCWTKIEPSDASWLHLSSNNSGYTVTIDKNESYETRSGKVIFCDQERLISDTLAVTQDASPNYYTLEREALIAVYKSLDGDNWERVGNTLGGQNHLVANWCTDAPISDWYGVTLDDNGHVEQLWVDFAGVGGTIPEEIGDLVYCKELSIHGELKGELPKRIGEMKRLRELLIGSSYQGSWPKKSTLTGDLSSSSLAQLAPQLKHIRLQDSYFTGEFPSWVSKMPATARFWLDGNCLSGKVPDEVIAHPSWNELMLDNSGKTYGQANMRQREGYVLYE